MKVKKYAESIYCKLTHNRYHCFYNIVNQGDYKEAHNVSFPDLLHTKFYSKKLTENSARTLGEILIKIADELSK